MLELFDTHFHPGDADPTSYCAELPAEHAYTLLAMPGSYDDSLACRSFAETIPNAYFACGVHPHEADEAEPERFTIFRNHPKLKAIGEIGLDYFYGYSESPAQRRVFKAFLDLALEWQLPAVIHLRDKDNEWGAYAEALELLTPFAAAGGGFVIHCFCGTPQLAQDFLDLGGYLGVTGIVTFKMAENIRAALKVIPAERLLIETDAPYLAPVPFRGKQNHPKYLVHIAEYVAAQRGITLSELAAQTADNGRRIFRIGKYE